MTIRRDVDALARAQRVTKTMGGVQDAGFTSAWYETDIRQRMTEAIREKSAIGERAVDLIQGQQTLFLEGGSTCVQLAKKISDHCTGLTILTNSAFVCLELGRNRDNVVVSLGGQFDANSGCFVGESNEEAASKFFVDIAFLSAKAFRPDEGTYESRPLTYRIKSIAASQCSRLALLVDHSKFGQRSLSKVLDISQIHDVVTDDLTPEQFLDELRNRNISTHVAELSRERAKEKARAS